MPLDHCPNCGEPIDERATICPHCGSDEETGWNPDVDYYSVELPEEDYDASYTPPPNQSHDSGAWLGRVVLAVSFLILLWAGYSAYEWAGVLPMLFLAGCYLFYRLGTKQADE